MHKSKNYDMATEVAMDKLMPKPIQITISMQGGGGLTGLGERPLTSVYGRPIPRTIYRDNGGGISGINKPININGQPHKLAWIRPDEASALKAMGGSGKKVEGIPAYDTNIDEWGGYDAGVDVSQGGAGAYGWDTGETDSYAAEQRDIETETEASQRQYEDAYSTQESVGRPPQSSGGRGADPRTLPDSKRPEEYKDYLGKGLFGEQYDFDDVKSLWMTQYIKAHPGGRRDTRTQEEIDIEDDWQKAKNAPGGLAALAAGFKVGDPYGNQMRESFNTIQKQLKKKFKSETDTKSVGQEDEEPYEMTREELSSLVKDIDGLEDFTPYSGIDYPMWAPGGMLTAGMNFLSRTVIGTGTVGGVGVHIHKDGSVTPVSPEDSPGYDHESMKGENVEPVRRRKQRGGFGYTQKDVEKLQEEPLTGMSGLLAKRGPTDKSAGTKRLEELLASLYPNRNINIG